MVTKLYNVPVESAYGYLFKVLCFFWVETVGQV